LNRDLSIRESLFGFDVGGTLGTIFEPVVLIVEDTSAAEDVPDALFCKLETEAAAFLALRRLILGRDRVLASCGGR
jgi:hypothetical protein